MRPNPFSHGADEGRGRTPGRAEGDAGRPNGLVGVGVLAALLLVWGLAGGGAGAPAKPPAVAVRHLTVGRYLRGGYWRADARTLLAAGRWLLEPGVPGAAGVTNLAPLPQLPNTNQASGQSPA